MFYVASKYTTETNYDKETGVVVPLEVRKKMHLEGLDVDEDGSSGAEKQQDVRHGSVSKAGPMNTTGEVIE